MKESRIEWTEATWNPVRGCTRVSEGCRFCYAERVAERWSKPGQPYDGLVEPAKVKGGHPRWTGKIMLAEHLLNEPRKWKGSKIIFVNSMSDLFHEAVPFEYIQRIFTVMRETPQHTYQILTKRPNRLLYLESQIEWPNNVWMGVSVEDERVDHRIESLRETNAKTKFLSLEPLIGPLPNLDLDRIDWVIIGGESGSHARIMDASWAEDLVDRCRSAAVPVFVKQMGTEWWRKHGKGSNFKGDDFSQFPEPLQIREYPEFEHGNLF